MKFNLNSKSYTNQSKFKNYFFKAAKNSIFAFISALSLITANKPANAQLAPASYFKSCDMERFGISIIYPFKYNIFAECQTTSPLISLPANLESKGIYNVNGHLRQLSIDALDYVNKDSTFQDSCVDISLVKNVLTATCTTKNNTSLTTSITLNEISNINGGLVYNKDQILSRTLDAIQLHAYDKHRNEFSPIPNQQQFQQEAKKTITDPDTSKVLLRSNMPSENNSLVRVFWRSNKNSKKGGTMVIVQSDDLLTDSTMYSATKQQFDSLI